MMHLQPDFWIAMVIGFVIIAGASWDRFDEPTWRPLDRANSRAWYRKLKPSFTTLRRKYRQARMAYVGIFSLLFLASALVPKLGGAIRGLGSEGPAGVTDTFAYPLSIAAVLMSVQTVPYLKVLEERARRLLHTWAKAPGGALHTVTELRRAAFDFQIYRDLEEFRNRSGELKEVRLQDTYQSSAEHPEGKVPDHILSDWAKISCILHYVNRSRTDPIGLFDSQDFDERFFEEYDEEYEDIKTRHGNLEIAIAHYSARAAEEEDVEALRTSLRKDLDRLLDRVYNFVACAVRCKQSTESNVVLALNKLGFRLPEPTVNRLDMASFVNAILGLAVVWPLVAFLAPVFFGVHADEAQQERLKEAFLYLPLRKADAAWWAISSILLHLSAILAGLSYRRHCIEQGRWSKREDGRPMERYFLASFLGMVTSYLVLLLLGSLFASLDPQALPGIGFLDKMGLLAVTSLMWAILPGISVWFAVYHFDSANFERPVQIGGFWILLQGLLMASATFLFADLYASTINNRPEIISAIQMQGFTPDQTGEIELTFALFCAGVVGCIGLFFGWLFPHRREWLFVRRFTGNWQLGSEQEPSYYVALGEKHEARLKSPLGKDLDQGTWRPEGNNVIVDWADWKTWRIEVNPADQHAAVFSAPSQKGNGEATRFTGRKIREPGMVFFV